MSYVVKCPGCNQLLGLGKVEKRSDGTVHCSRCRFNATMQTWLTHTHAGPGVPPLALPVGTYVSWGTRTTENRDTGLIRNIMEDQGGMRPGADARRGGVDYTKLQAGTTAVRIYIVKDDLMLRGQYYRGTANGVGTGVCALLLNGSGASIGHYMADVITGYQGLGSAVLAVDYRGVGKSTGRGTSHGLYTDAKVMLEYLTDDPGMNGVGWKSENVIIHGYSMGSGPATQLARHNTQANARVGGLVLHCPFSSFGSAAAFKSGGSWIAGKVASLGVGYNNIGKLVHINLPMHVVYARDDTYVAAQDGRDLAAVNRGGAVTTRQEYRGDHTHCGRIFIAGYNVTPPTNGTLEDFVTNLPRQ